MQEMERGGVYSEKQKKRRKRMFTRCGAWSGWVGIY
jgi:hypothetical protein